MYFLIFIALFIIVYVSSFKDSFDKAKIDKVVPVLIIIGIISLLLTVVSSLN